MNNTNSNHDSGPASQSVSPGPPSNATKILHHHDEHFSKRDFIIDPAFFPNVQPNDLFEIYDPALPKESQKSLVIQWTGVDKDTPLKQPVQVNVARALPLKWHSLQLPTQHTSGFL